MKTHSAPLSGFNVMENEMMQTVVHDMRTPMTVIKGYLQLLLSGGMGEMKSDQLEVLQRSVGPLEDLIQMTENLLQSMTLQQDDVQLHLESVDLDQLLSETIGFYQMPFQQRGMKFYRNGNTLNQKVLVDLFWFKRALNNLVWNAFKFTPDKGLVTFEVQHKEGGIEISVQDTGRGIPADKIEKIFQKFEQTDRPQDCKMGSGLGLWICRRVMELHGGTITVHSQVGYGSRFSLWLPPSKQV